MRPAEAFAHSNTGQRMLRWATDTKDFEAAERVAKLTCLRPIDDAAMREATLALVRRAVDLGQGNTR